MNLAEEIRNGYVIGPETKKVWEVELEITKHILDVCRRHNLKIWADWGTLLGAVREKGFIPWDDDIDLMMMRDDYEKLIRLADSEFRHPFFLQSFHTDKQYYRGHAQVRYDGTTAILPDDINQPFHQGIFVDIFVYDNIPDDKGRKWEKAIHNAKWALKCLQTAYYKRFDIKKPVTTVKFLIARTACMFLGPGNIYRFYERQFTKWNSLESRAIACPAYDYRQIERETKLKEWYRETLFFPFENIEIPVPGKFDEVLRVIYGQNYMKPCKAPSGHGEIILYAEKSYIDVLQELKHKK